MGCAIATEDDSTGTSTTWALCWQAAVGRDFFVHASLPGLIRGRLIGAHRHRGRILIDYLLLPTEIHAITVIPAGDSAGGVARAFGNVVSRWVREVQPVRSPVLAGPYRAQSIRSVDALRQEVRMLAWRPVFLDFCRAPSHYPLGALPIGLGSKGAEGFNAGPLLSHFGANVPESRVALKRWIARRPSDQDWREWELMRGLELATGSVGPHATMAKSVDGAAAMLIAAGGTFGIDGALELLERWVSAKIQPMNGLHLHEASSAMAARGRALVACLAVAHRLCSAASVARYFGRAKSTLSEQMTACRLRPSDRSILVTPVHRILDEAGALKAQAQPGTGAASVENQARSGLVGD